MEFPSKKDIWLGLIIWLSIIVMASIYIYDTLGFQINGILDILGFTVVLLTIAFLLWVWYGTGYKIEGGLLNIKSGPLKSTVEIKKIRKIRATKNPMSAPALSLDRIEIIYGEYDMKIISPEKKIEFIEALMNENPAIRIDKNLHK